MSALFVSHRHGFPALFMADLGTDELLQCTARRDLNPWSVRTCSAFEPDISATERPDGQDPSGR